VSNTIKRLLDYAGFSTTEHTQAQHLIMLAVSEVLVIAYQELHPQAYAQLLTKIQQRFEQ